MALLAETTLGVDGSTLRAHVRADVPEVDETREYHLVVQSYDGPGFRHGRRPVGSLQRVVTGAELKRGISVNLVELRDAAREAPAKALVLAWIEDREADLEFDARAARPHVGSVYGAVRRAAGDDVVQITLSRKLAA
jgi:hypothetical protein